MKPGKALEAGFFPITFESGSPDRLLRMEYHVCSFFGDSRQSLPAGDTACKFVLVRNQKTTWLVFGPIEKYHYHAHLVEGLSDHLGIASVWVKKPDLVNIPDKDVEIMGGGIMNFDSNENLLKFDGISRAYGSFDSTVLRQFLANCKVFQKFTVIVGA